ncbi:MAG: efflux RND transporter permease subunit [Gammaproteobacteria bacterium]|nr:efflux RND transporter permease subunit [Gammaproteobacteria bacterium]
MRMATRWFLDNPVAANLLMVFILAAGLLSLDSLRVESFPQISPTELSISVAYSNATAKQVDEGITQRIEDAISGVSGIKSIVSESTRGHASVTVKKKSGVNIDRLMEDLRNQVESISGFPEKAQRPRIVRDEYGNLAAYVIVFGGDDPAHIQLVSTRVEKALKKHPAISQVANLGKKNRELVIEPDSLAIQRLGIDLQSLASRIRLWSLEYPGGELQTARGKITLRGDRFADNLLALQNLPVMVSKNSSVLLKDIATVKRDYQPGDSIVRYQGKQAIALEVSTSVKDNLLNVSKAVEQVLREIEPTLPTTVKTAVMADMGPYIREQVSLLSSNALQGLFIVLVLLGLFLEVRLAFWVALGIPISLAGAVWLMSIPSIGYSINDITLFGMILGLGLLIDDAVVVGESIHHARKTEPNPKLAAFKGVDAVTVATVFGVLTTIAAFSPMLWIENELAKVLAGFSAVVIFALIFSLIESKFILPAHLCSVVDSHDKSNFLATILAQLRKVCVGSLDSFSTNIYQPTLKRSLQNRKVSLLVFVTVVLVIYGALMKGHIKMVFFPEIPGRYGTLTVTMDKDAPLSLTKANVFQLEAAIKHTNDLLKNEFALEQLPFRKTLVSMGSEETIELTVELSNQALAVIPSEHLLAVWQQQTGEIEGSYASKFTFSEELTGGAVISVSANNRDLARHVTSKLKQELKLLPGVSSVFDDSQAGKRQLQIAVNQRGVQLGVSQRQLATLVGSAFGEIEVHRLIDNDEETRLVIRLPETEKKTLEQLKATPVRIQGNSYVSLSEISEFSYSREPDVLYRRNREGVVNLYWRQNRSLSSPEETLEILQETVVPELTRMYPEVRINAEGEFAEIAEVQTGFRKAILLTILLIYTLLAVPLKSYWQPLIIMSIIPFGFAGSILGHALMGLSVSLLSLFGMMAMMGVVINDSLVLMTRFNQLHRAGMPTGQALMEAGKRRMQAIFLTTVTTVCGLLPLLSETSEQAQYLKPAAVSLVFGELFATPITLILIPILLSFGKYPKSDHAEDDDRNVGQKSRFNNVASV